MFGLFTPRAPTVASAVPGWNGLMGWRVLTYEEGERWLSLRIEPMTDGPCRVYVPGTRRWALQAPAWARGRRESILQRLRQIAWNRDLVWIDGDDTPFEPQHVHRPAEDSIEASSDGQRLLRLRMFSPDAAGRWSRRDSKRAWCIGTELVCRRASGWVRREPRPLVAGSVYKDIELAALMRNPKVTVSFVRAPQQM